MTLISRLVFFNDEMKTKKESSERITKNEISIVIPVKDNQKGIDNYLTKFFKTHSKTDFPKEIIIVDNNSSPRIELKTEFMKFGLPIKLIECKKVGPASARNKGAKIAKGKWLLFNDSDCIPTKSIIKGYLKADNNSVAYAGNIESLDNDKLSKYYESQEILIPLKTYDENGDFVPQYLITANSLIWKKAFDEIGGFNEQIAIAGGEDVDLGLRLSQIGNLSYAFDSIAIHDFSDGFVGFYKRFKRYGQGNRIVEELWNTDLSPTLFRPNERTFANEILAKFQYIGLRIGYRKADKIVRKYGLQQRV
ncbi:glycosyl transferase [Winogradskyella sp. J14-2]|uniref:glycosyltransferase n=1 Tax=Winogradskyella sp. J14-2 TaxID=1936080 RepID=UPI000972D68C|nr:glycosyltransferase [Winogradskyella sp. J14-2]APY06859.1 glycosyl transferase [Winogradskyella sp. J14-2]APY06871.1 glycosyl transferase [Winogradskyella sp. J14-2]